MAREYRLQGWLPTGINIEHRNSGFGAGRDRDQRARVLPPDRFDLSGVCCCSEAAVLIER